ncbi:MAG TPA: hypothetical protein VFU79_07490 [Nitrososphaeraceae archaeon]|nr:hypothetical protein [Nitrososphaeraceae archaeon]
MLQNNSYSLVYNDDNEDDLNPGHLQVFLSNLLTKLHLLVGLSSGEEEE